jgi:membrane fusion protein, multidrug efflux system
MLETPNKIARSPTKEESWVGQKHRRLWLVTGVLAIAAGLYFTTGALVAYTADAYVRSDLVTIAPQVAGVIQTVAVQDNQTVAVGDRLLAIDPQPFRLEVDLKQQQVASLEATVAVRTEARAAGKADLDAANADLRLAQEQFARVKALTAERVLPQSALDKAVEQLRAAQDRVAVRQSQAQVDERQIAEARSEVVVARAALALARYALTRTQLTAPVAGYINNLHLRPGDYARVGEAIIGIVDESQWRVIANFKEEVAASLAPGTPVWIWFDAAPWHLVRGHVQGVGRAIAREQLPAQLLPYVAPTTDWIRLRRRLPVTILIDHPGTTQGLFMGADARVLFFR